MLRSALVVLAVGLTRVAWAQERPEDPDPIARGVRRLVELQENGATWPYEGRYRIEGEIPVAYVVGGTSLAGLALLYAAEPEDLAAQRAFHAGLGAVLDRFDHAQLERARVEEYDMRVLGQAYALLFLCHVRAGDATADERDRVDAAIPRLANALVYEQMTDGGWNYQGRPVHAPFVTASVVQALLWADDQGAEVAPEVFRRARVALARSRIADGAFRYFDATAKKRPPQDRLPGSAARSAVCETMLVLLGGGSTDRVAASIEAFHAHWPELEQRRGKSGTHAGPYLIAPYYFYYGHRYAAQAVELLPEAARSKERERLAELLLRTRAADGTWNDREFPRSRNTGTALALLALRSEAIPLPPPFEED